MKIFKLDDPDTCQVFEIRRNVSNVMVNYIMEVIWYFGIGHWTETRKMYVFTFFVNMGK